MRVLFVGNSYTARNDLPKLFASIAQGLDPPTTIDTRMIVAGGASLRRHWNAGAAVQAMAAERFDWVVLQEQSTLPIKNAARYHDNVRLFDAAIREHGARTALYLTWARRDAPDSQAVLSEAVRTIAAQTGARVVPVGDAWQELRRHAPEVALHTDDGSHPTLAGSYLAACVFAAALLDAVPSRPPPAASALDTSTVAAIHGAAATYVQP